MHRSVLGLIALAAVLAWAVACGGDDDDGSDDTSEVPATERCTYTGAGAVFRCASRAGCSGYQHCLPEGRYSPAPTPSTTRQTCIHPRDGARENKTSANPSVNAESTMVPW